MRPRARATASRNTRYGQKRTAGPQAGPRVASSQRSGGSVSCCVTLTAGLENDDARHARRRGPSRGTAASAPRACGGPRGRSGAARRPRARAGRSWPSSVTCWTSASFGRRRTSGCSRLLRAVATRRTRSRRRPGVASSATRVDRERLALDALRVARGRRSSDLARPGAVLGREDAVGDARDRRAGPKRCRTRSGCTEAARPRTTGGPRARAARACGACSSVDCQPVSVSSPPRLTATSPFSTTRLARVGASPGRSGTRSATGAPSGRHAADARLDGPGDAEAERAGDLEPRRVAALAAGRRRPRAARRRVRRIDGSAGPSARRPLTSHPGASARARRGGSANCSVKLSPGGTGPEASTRCTPRDEAQVQEARRRGARAPPRGRRRRGRRPGSSSRRGRASAHVPSAAAWTSALSSRRLSPSRRTRLGVVTQRGSQGAGRVRRALQLLRGARGSACSARPRRADVLRARSTRAAAAGRAFDGPGGGSDGQRPVRRTTPNAARRARRRSVRRRFRSGRGEEEPHRVVAADGSRSTRASSCARSSSARRDRSAGRPSGPARGRRCRRSCALRDRRSASRLDAASLDRATCSSDSSFVALLLGDLPASAGAGAAGTAWPDSPPTTPPATPPGTPCPTPRAERRSAERRPVAPAPRPAATCGKSASFTWSRAKGTTMTTRTAALARNQRRARVADPAGAAPRAGARSRRRGSARRRRARRARRG